MAVMWVEGVTESSFSQRGGSETLLPAPHQTPCSKGLQCMGAEPSSIIWSHFILPTL